MMPYRRFMKVGDEIKMTEEELNKEDLMFGEGIFELLLAATHKVDKKIVLFGEMEAITK